MWPTGWIHLGNPVNNVFKPLPKPFKAVIFNVMKTNERMNQINFEVILN